MSVIYAVRCNFSRPDLEAEWNAWYNGPKMADMLAKPLFLSGQRFQAVGLDQAVKYLALWVLESPEALETPEYKANWGFLEWTPCMTDGSGNLYRAPGGDVPDLLRIPPGGSLYVAAFDNFPSAKAESRHLGVQAERPDVLWMPATGLDRSCPVMGLKRLPDLGSPPTPLPPHLASGIRETLYRPITECRRAR